MSDLRCESCNTPALVVYQQQPLCGPCALQALDGNRLVIEVDDTDTSAEDRSSRQSV